MVYGTIVLRIFRYSQEPGECAIIGARDGMLEGPSARTDVLMQDYEHWMDLCEQASVEQDADKLLELIREINRLLEEKEERLLRLRLGKRDGNGG